MRAFVSCAKQTIWKPLKRLDQKHLCSGRLLAETMRGISVHALAASDTDSSDDEIMVDINRYKALALSEGLSTWQYRVHAVRELTAILQEVYSLHSTKAVQQAMYSDAVLAVRSCDSRPGCKEAVVALVKTAEKLLPQQKRQQLASEHKRTFLALLRQAKSHSAGDCSDDQVCTEESPEQKRTSLGSLSSDVLYAIMKNLDPLSLVALACCSRSCQDVALGDGLWRPWACHIFPKQAAAFMASQEVVQIQPGASPPENQDSLHLWHALFRDQARVSPQLTQLWCCRRVRVNGRPRWCAPACSLYADGTFGRSAAANGVALMEYPSAGKAVAAAAQSLLDAGLACDRQGMVSMTLDMVVRWLKGLDIQGGHVAKHESNSSAGDSSESEAEEVRGLIRARTGQQLRLWSLPKT